MKIRRTGLHFTPKDRAYKISDTLSLGEVCGFLTRYLEGKIVITDKPYDAVEQKHGGSKRRRYKRRKI